jgi:hypothetical protein
MYASAVQSSERPRLARHVSYRINFRQLDDLPLQLVPEHGDEPVRAISGKEFYFGRWRDGWTATRGRRLLGLSVQIDGKAYSLNGPQWAAELLLARHEDLTGTWYYRSTRSFLIDSAPSQDRFIVVGSDGELSMATVARDAPAGLVEVASNEAMWSSETENRLAAEFSAYRRFYSTPEGREDQMLHTIESLHIAGLSAEGLADRYRPDTVALLVQLVALRADVRRASYMVVAATLLAALVVILLR